MKLAKSLCGAALTLAVTASLGANAATYSLTGTITQCIGTCSIFTAVGQTASFSFDGADGAGAVSAGSISNVDISLSTPSGGALAFVNGTALSSTLTADASNDLTGGTVVLQGTGATTGIVAQGHLDIDTRSWTAFVVSAGDGSLQQIAAGTLDSGTLSAVPVPAAAWLFGSALLGLGSVARRRQYQ